MRYVEILALSLLLSAQAKPASLRGKWLEIRVGEKKFSVLDYGAKGDGKTVDTEGIQKAFDAAAKAGGGTVLFPRHSNTDSDTETQYLSTAIKFASSNTVMNVPLGVRLLFSDDRSLYSNSSDLITVSGLSHVGFTGGGIVDGQGAKWWACRVDNCFRPRMVSTSHVDHLLMHDLVFKDSPNHVLELYADFTELSHVTVYAPPSTSSSIKVNGTKGPSHNTDAVDVHGSPFYVHDCHFDTGDDNIAAHSNDTLVEDCYFGHGHGASIGSIGTAYLKVSGHSCSDRYD